MFASDSDVDMNQFENTNYDQQRDTVQAETYRPRIRGRGARTVSGSQRSTREKESGGSSGRHADRNERSQPRGSLRRKRPWRSNISDIEQSSAVPGFSSSEVATLYPELAQAGITVKPEPYD